MRERIAVLLISACVCMCACVRVGVPMWHMVYAYMCDMVVCARCGWHLQPNLEGRELLAQHEQVAHEKEVSVQHTAGSTHTVCPHLQSNHTKLDTEDTQHDGRGKGRGMNA